MAYKSRPRFKLSVGFDVNGADVEHAATSAKALLRALPASLYRSLDFKTTSAIVGTLFCESLAERVGAIVNPIEKGHPDIVPTSAATASEERLRNYPHGLEIKTTIGNIPKGANLRAGQPRVESITAITWQAHHREVKELMGITWDFTDDGSTFHYPSVTGVFYANNLVTDDWGEISGTEGRNTKVSGMRASGKAKMGSGWVLIMDDPKYIKMFGSVLDAHAS
jgi:hypothetical protein